MKNRLKSLKSWHWFIVGTAGLFLGVGLVVVLTSKGDSEPTPTASADAQSAAVVMEVEGMYCSGCARTVENNLSSMDGVGRAKVNLGKSQAKIWTENAASLHDKKLKKTVEEAGYKAGAIKRR